MVKFLEGNGLNHGIEQIFDKAKENIFLICPYIKVHARYKSTLKSKMENPKLHITVVFGKNEGDLTKSMKSEDFEFFKKFPNIQIRYEKRLHAKYFANEKAAIITSMNLYSYSQDNNIESGVLTERKLLNAIDDNFYSRATKYFERVIEQSELLFDRVPIYSSGTLGIGLGKKYLNSNTETDLLSDHFATMENHTPKTKVAHQEIREQKETPVKEEVLSSIGYCIRTGEKISFNIEKPLSYQAYRSWKRYSDADYSESYCHFSGEESNGKTSVNKPILKKNWKKAQAVNNL